MDDHRLDLRGHAALHHSALSRSTSPTSISYSAHCLIELPTLPRPQDVLRTVPERNPAGRLEDLSGEGWAAQHGLL